MDMYLRMLKSFSKKKMIESEHIQMLFFSQEEKIILVKWQEEL
jgi:hypothetical protein